MENQTKVLKHTSSDIKALLEMVMAHKRDIKVATDTKQDVVEDLSTIRNGAVGVPTMLATVHTILDKVLE